jgi:hypothetical protein
MAPTYVVSDVHGHLGDLRLGLARAGLVDLDGGWVGEDADLWVLGDLMDRGPDGAGVVHYLRALTAAHPERVRVLLGNHEALALGAKLFDDARFTAMWRMNGGRAADQDALDDDDVEWLRGLPAVGVHAGHLLMHSDTPAYLGFGGSVEEVNDTVRTRLCRPDLESYWDMWARLTDRFGFAGPDGEKVAESMLETYGGGRLVHGHSIIGMMLGRPSATVTGPLLYAGGRAVAIDGGRYDGGPLLFVRLA